MLTLISLKNYSFWIRQIVDKSFMTKFFFHQNFSSLILFICGPIFLFIGILIWVPLLWGSDSYPLLLHRFLMINGFTAAFSAGFLMHLFSKFSATKHPVFPEAGLFIVLQFLGIGLIIFYGEAFLNAITSLQGLILLVFMLRRVQQLKSMPGHFLVPIFIVLMIWASAIFTAEHFRGLHHEGVFAVMIFALGAIALIRILRPLSRPPPGRQISFVALGLVGSYFFSYGELIRAIIIALVGSMWWQLYRPPLIRSSLSWSLWAAAWFVMIIFLSRPFFKAGEIHLIHGFFIAGVVLMALLFLTRVLSSGLQNSKILFWVTGLVILAALTRVSAYFLPQAYLSHLAYAAIVLTLGTGLWGAALLWQLIYPKSQEKLSS
jgi:hypothetical protein